MAGRVLFGMLSDRLFGGRRRMPLVLAGVGSTACTLLILSTGAGASTLGLAALTAVSASSGSAGTAFSTRGWPSPPGLGRQARRSASAWRSPRQA
jgi:hypothetical protein